MTMRRVLIVGAAVLLVAGAAWAQGEDAGSEAEVDPLAELAALGDAMADEGPEGGGSIRAKKDADLQRSKRIKDKRNFEAKVQSVQAKSFPIVAVTVKVTRPGKEGPGAKVGRNQIVVVVPKLKVEGKSVAMEDEETRRNAGAFYLKAGDKVAVRLGANKGKYWEADYIERK
jgi:hypothetical protein